MSLTSPKSRVRPNVSTWAVCGGRRSDRQMVGHSRKPRQGIQKTPLVEQWPMVKSQRQLGHGLGGRLARRANALVVLRIAHLSFSVQVRALTRAGPLLVDGPPDRGSFSQRKVSERRSASALAKHYVTYIEKPRTRSGELSLTGRWAKGPQSLTRSCWCCCGSSLRRFDFRQCPPMLRMPCRNRLSGPPGGDRWPLVQLHRSRK